MKSACYTSTSCEYCLDDTYRRSMPGDGPYASQAVERWVWHRLPKSELSHDPRGACVGCSMVRANLCIVLANMLDRLGIEVR